MSGNILIVDDSFVDRKIIKQVLESRIKVLKVFEAEDGCNIKENLMKNNIHMCILDVHMPVKNGFQILEEMKVDPNLMDIPVIICTGTEDKEAIEKALSLGAYDYFSKPLSAEAMKISLPLKVKNAIELMKRKEDIIYLSYRDKLTGLYNRRYCEEEMKRLDTERNLPISLIMGDLNGLKLTNDAFGHEAGDKLLIKIADIIKNECRKDEIVARCGGDEFLVVLPKTKEEDAKKIVSRIKDRCEEEKEEPIKPSLSMGVASKISLEQDIMELYKIAEDKMYQNKLIEGKSMRSSIISTLRKVLYERSHETEEHSKRLMKLCIKVGKAMGLSIDQINNLKLLALLHDIGITGIPDHILARIGNLTAEEENIFMKHCEIGYRIAKSISDISHISEDILSHHEHWNGTGYPQGLKKEKIPLNSRIISILDTYDSLLNGILNQNILSRNDALEFIKKHSGEYFDPKIVDIFLGIEMPSNTTKT